MTCVSVGTAPRPLPTLPDPPPPGSGAGDWRSWMRALGMQGRVLRKLIGLSQDELARLAGVSQGAVSRLESGRGLATPMLMVVKIALALASAVRAMDAAEVVDPDVRRWLDLLVEKAPAWAGAGSSRASVGCDLALEEVVRRYRAASRAQRSAILMLLRSFAA